MILRIQLRGMSHLHLNKSDIYNLQTQKVSQFSGLACADFLSESSAHYAICDWNRQGACYYSCMSGQCLSSLQRSLSNKKMKVLRYVNRLYINPSNINILAATRIKTYYVPNQSIKKTTKQSIVAHTINRTSHMKDYYA